ncbi:MAG: exosortase O [Alphaproteobacteria bacterium]|nr:exosortase O [Alphaproteobacteria bacterium]MCB9797423.1 exosortase O [Alphaproteobacteria bacterium]
MPSPKSPPAGLLASSALLLAWLALMAPALRWIQGTLGHSDFRLEMLLVLGLGALVLARGRAAMAQAARAFAAGPRAEALPLGLVGACALGFLVVERWLDIDLISAFLFGLGSYGILGLYLPRSAWHRGLPAALMLVGALPFGHQADIYVGFPARVGIARLAEGALVALGVPVDGTGTVLRVMSRAAHIDLPCSGVRSLWAGGLFFLAATWLEQRRPGLRWLAAGLTLVLAILAANLVRVTTLVLLDTVMGLSFVAQLVHAPLGVLGFALACAFGWLLLRRCPGLGEGAATPLSPGRPALGLGLAGALALGALLYTPRPLPAHDAEPLALHLPAELQLEPLALNDKELDLFARHSASDASKWALEYKGLRGQLVLVRSRSWRAHHPPALCLQGQGFTIEASESVFAGANMPVRLMQLDGGQRLASSWFQSAELTTDDFAERTWDGLLHGRPDWVMVSLLLDPAPEDVDLRVASLHRALHRAVADALVPPRGSS